jgi:hypothetical protein
MTVKIQRLTQTTKQRLMDDSGVLSTTARSLSVD